MNQPILRKYKTTEHSKAFPRYSLLRQKMTPEQIQDLIDEATKPLNFNEDIWSTDDSMMLVILHRFSTDEDSGVRLKGGADYKRKDVTVSQIISGSLADCDGRLQVGDWLLSINGKSTIGANNKEAVGMLEQSRENITLVLSRSRNSAFATKVSNSLMLKSLPARDRPLSSIFENEIDTKSLLSEFEDMKYKNVNRGLPKTIQWKRKGVEVGFDLGGGINSPLGDKPLTVRNVSKNNSAENKNELRAGDEILKINGADCTKMCRSEATNYIKKLNGDYLTLVIRQ